MLLHSRAVAVVVATAAALTACGSSKKGGGGGGGGGGGPSGPPVAGAVLQIQSATLPEGNGAPTVTFRVTDPNGNPVDLVAEQNAGTTSANFAIGELLPSDDYQSIWVNDVNGKTYKTAPGGADVQPKLPTAKQAAYKTPTVDKLQGQGNGVYVATLDPPNATGLDRTRTFTVAGWISRTTNNVRQGGSNTLNFVPAGGSPQVLQEVTDQACNKCHGVVRAHGIREGTQVCIVCHSPVSTDPESGNTVDFKVMIHKIHDGSGLTQHPYAIVGYQQSYLDFSDVTLPQEVTNCETCHQGTDAARYKTNAALNSCTSCHDYVRFTDNAAGTTATCSITKRPGASGAAAEAVPCLHPAGVASTADCASCHTPQGSAVSITEAHQSTRNLVGNYKWEILDITNTAVGQSPKVKFRATNPNASNAPYTFAEPEFNVVSTGTNPSVSSSIRVQLGFLQGGEFTNVGTGATAPGQPARIDIRRVASGGGTEFNPAVTANGDGTFTADFAPVVVPQGVDTVAAQMEGHPTVAIQGINTNIPVQNIISFKGIDGGAGTPRRVVAPTDKCNACHYALTAHGQNRNDETRSCALCHNPQATDQAQLPAPVNQATETRDSPIDFKWLIHVVHGGEIKKVQQNIYGFGGRPVAFPLEFPTSRSVAECTACHQDDSYQLPVPYAHDPAFNQFDTTYNALVATDLTDNKRWKAQYAVCTSCHDNVTFDQPEAPTCVGPNSGPAGSTGKCLHSGGAVGTTIDCSACHNPNSPFSVKAVHNVP